MQASILDLRRRMPEVLQALDRNEKVTILYRGRQRAVLLAVGSEQEHGERVAADAHPAFGMWSDNNDNEDVAKHVRRLRQGRRHAL